MKVHFKKSPQIGLRITLKTSSGVEITISCKKKSDRGYYDAITCAHIVISEVSGKEVADRAFERIKNQIEGL